MNFNIIPAGNAKERQNMGLLKKRISVFLMQAPVELKLSGSSFVGGHLSGGPACYYYIRATFMDTQILHRRGFDAHVPAYLTARCILSVL
jgi:hypothetical protein